MRLAGTNTRGRSETLWALWDVWLTQVLLIKLMMSRWVMTVSRVWAIGWHAGRFYWPLTLSHLNLLLMVVLKSNQKPECSGTNECEPVLVSSSSKVANVFCHLSIAASPPIYPKSDRWATSWWLHVYYLIYSFSSYSLCLAIVFVSLWSASLVSREIMWLKCS